MPKHKNENHITQEFFFPNGCPGLCQHRPGHPLGKKIPVWYDFHFRVLAFLQGLSTCFHLNLALPKQKIQITIQTRGAWNLAMTLLKESSMSPPKMGQA